MPTTASVNKRSLAVISPQDNYIELFGITSDKRNLGQISFYGGAWSTWSLVGIENNRVYKTAPSAISTQRGVFDLFVVQDEDNLITRRSIDGSWSPNIGWTFMQHAVAEAENPISLEPILNSNSALYLINLRLLNGWIADIRNRYVYPYIYWMSFLGTRGKSSSTTVISGSDSMEQFYIGSDDRIYHSHWARFLGYNLWESPTAIGDQKFISPPTAISNAPGRVDVFGIAPDQTVMHNSYQTTTTSGGWTGWTQLGTRRFASSISAVVTRGGNQIELWGVGTDGALWHRSGNGNNGTWPVDWDSHGGQFISAPAVVSPAEGVYDVFAISIDGSVKHARRTERPAAWIPTYGSWNSLGGNLSVYD